MAAPDSASHPLTTAHGTEVGTGLLCAFLRKQSSPSVSSTETGPKTLPNCTGAWERELFAFAAASTQEGAGRTLSGQRTPFAMGAPRWGF